MIGRITKLISGLYTVYSEETNKYYDLKPLGIFRHKEIQPKVGDIEEFNETSILKIKPRFNDLIRPVICNIDQALVVTSLKEPELNLNLLDRFLVILEYNDIKPILIFSKWDLVKEEEKKEILEIIDYYKSIGYETVITSTKQNLLNNVDKYLKDKVSVITGESGTGKSSLINELGYDLELKTNEISKALNRGKHTTRHTELIRLCDGWLADTPGFGNLGFINMSETDLSHSMIEFFENSNNCKYNGCLHEKEPKCYIKQLVEENKIKESRYKNYLLFLEEVRKNRKW
jgi:ribosome biogenesis GTPase